MSRFANLSLKRGLLLLVLFTAGFAFLTNFLAFMAYEHLALRKGLVRNLETQAKVLSQAVSADLDFGTLFDSNRSLKYLTTNRHILAARIFDKGGRVFATMVARPHGIALPETPPVAGHAIFHEGVLDLFVEIRQEGDFKGTLFLRSDLDEIRTLFSTAARIMAIAGLGLILLVTVAALVLQRRVAAPILGLAETAMRISRERDFNIRLETDQRGEIGELKAAFNEMLNQIQIRDATLLEYQEHLEDLVQQRSEQLLQAQQLMSTTLDALPVYIAILDGKCTILATNRKWAEGGSTPNPFIAKARVGDDYLATCRSTTRSGEGLPELGKFLEEVVSRDQDSARLDYDFDSADGHQWFTLLATRFLTAGSYHAVLMHLDTKDQKLMEIQLGQAQKLESIGQLAAGIAHEINTPIQYVGDNLIFLKGAFQDIWAVLGPLEALLKALDQGGNPAIPLEASRQALEKADLTFLRDEMPTAIQQALDGVSRVAKIVRAMKDFSHPGSAVKTPTDLNRAIESTSVVCRNEWKYVADLELDLDPGLPQVPCLPDEFNQVILNLLINASHAIREAIQKEPGGGRGRIVLSTRHADGWVEIRVMDTGTGIPDNIQTRIFEPFFTTKEVGKGTGQGLAMVYSVIVQKHGGEVKVVSELGKGATFILRIPAAGMGS